MLNNVLTPEFLTQFGAVGIILIVCIKALSKVYNDMREDSAKREERIMSYLDKKAEVDKQVATTLKHIDDRLVALESCFKNK